MFAHYSKWIFNFSKKITPLIDNKNFPVCGNAAAAFEELKLDIANSVVAAVDSSLSFTIESDASDHSIAAQLLQNGTPSGLFQ